MEELFCLQRSLLTIYNIVTFLQRCSDDEPAHALGEGLHAASIPLYPYLYALTQEVKTYPQMVKRIDQILDKFGQTRSSTSSVM